MSPEPVYRSVIVHCRAQMKKVMVTVLRHNSTAHEFFINKLKYVLFTGTLMYPVSQ